MKTHVNDVSFSEWVNLNRKSEHEVTDFFENIIKVPISNTKDF